MPCGHPSLPLWLCRPRGKVLQEDPRVGRRPFLELVWTDRVPGSKDLLRLNAVWQGLDHDAPPITENGVLAVWRKPLVALAEAAAVLHVLGWHCQWRAVPDESDLFCLCEDEWQASMEEVERRALDALCWRFSNPERLGVVHPWDVHVFQGWSRSIDKLLPPAGPRPARGRRRFGRRRGVRRNRPSCGERRSIAR